MEEQQGRKQEITKGSLSTQGRGEHGEGGQSVKDSGRQKYHAMAAVDSGSDNEAVQDTRLLGPQ